LRRVAILRVHKPSARELSRRVRDGRPCVLLGMMDNWRARERWTPGFLAERFGAPTVGVQRWTAGDFASLRFEQMKLADYLDRYTRDACDGLHLAAHVIGREMSDLRADVEFPKGFAPPVDGGPQVFLSPTGAVTPLHFDVCHNFYAQVSGRKRFLLVDPAYGPELGALPPWRSRYWWTSPVDPESDDRPRRAGAAIPVDRVELAPGEILFLPGGYWHQVRTLERAIAVAYFFEHGLRQRVTRRALRALGRPVT
jgi:hypothetical protein